MEPVSKQDAFKQLMVSSSPRMKEQNMTQLQEIRRRPNGSIDTGHYAQIGRRRRSDALYDGCRAITKFVGIYSRLIKWNWMPSLKPNAGSPSFRVGIS